MACHYSFSYFNCQSCASRVNCMHCGQEIAQALRNKGIAGVNIDMPHKNMELELGEVPEDDILDYLETIGVFVN